MATNTAVTTACSNRSRSNSINMQRADNMAQNADEQTDTLAPLRPTLLLHLPSTRESTEDQQISPDVIIRGGGRSVSASMGVGGGMDGAPAQRVSDDSSTSEGGAEMMSASRMSRKQSRLARRRSRALGSFSGTPYQAIGGMLLPPPPLEKPASMTPEQTMEDDRLRRKLAYYFLNPYEKWQASRECPWKLFIQVVKIVFVTTQLITFASSRAAHITFQEETRTVLRHVLLHNWTDTRDVFVYPPGAGPYGVYTRGGFEEALRDVFCKYYYLNSTLYNIVAYAPTNMDEASDEGFGMISVHLRRYQEGHEFPANGTYSYDAHEITVTKQLHLNTSTRQQLDDDPAVIWKVLDNAGIHIHTETLIDLRVSFDMQTVRRAMAGMPRSRPDCFVLTTNVIFDNTEASGFVQIDLQTELSYAFKCDGRVLHEADYALNVALFVMLDAVVAFACVMSCVLCTRSLVRAQILRSRLSVHFRTVRRQPLSGADGWELFNGWYAMIVVDDLLIIFGTIFKTSIEFRYFDSAMFTAAAMSLGVGTLLVWCGLLRYLGFFTQYNILILTLKKSLPNVCRFLVCATFLYCGFMFCGWVVLGPYCLKFRSLFNAFSAMFALINGDDMFATFYTISDKTPPMVLLFSRVYLVLFISLFIYVVLSLFISIIMDAYEVVKDRYTGVEEVSRLRQFAAELHETPRTGNFGRGRRGEITTDATGFPAADAGWWAHTDTGASTQSVLRRVQRVVLAMCPCLRWSREHPVSQYEQIG